MAPGISAAIDAVTTPAHRLALILATVHAARTQDIRHLQLDDNDLGNRWLALSGTARPLRDCAVRDPAGDPIRIEELR